MFPLTSPPLFALWQFASAGMLAWGAAAVVPLLIHLWSRRRHRQEPWAAMTFLLAALRKNARRIFFEQWILLALRTAILVLFALALADPRLSLFASLAGRTGGQTHAVLVFDASYSMGYRDAEKSRFEAAKDLAAQLVANSPEGDGFSVLLMADQPRVVIGEPAFDKSSLQAEIAALTPFDGSANLPRILTEIETVVRQAKEQHARLTQQRVYFFSDLQHVTWNDATSVDGKQRLARLAETASLELIDVAGNSETNNLAVVRVDVDSTTGNLVAAGSEVQIRAECQNFGRDERRRLAVEVRVDGERIREERVDCPGGGRTAIAIPYRFAAAGEHIVEVRLADDALLIDNRRWLSVPVRESIRVLCVGGRPGETRNLALALAPSKRTTESLEVIEAPESRLLDGDLAKFDCIFACNIGRLSSEQAAALSRFASGGGGLVIFLGDLVQTESYNQLLVDAREQSLLPARLVEFKPTGNYHFDPLDYRHTIAAPFRGFPQAGLLTTPIWKYVRFELAPDASTALGFNTGDPAIIERTFGRGRCILVATAAAPDDLDRSTDPPTPWTALPSWPSFPPLVHEMLKCALAGTGESRNVLVGDDLSSSIKPTGAEQTVRLTGPANLSERLPLNMLASEAKWSFGPLTASGVYNLQSSAGTQQFAVNINPRESDLTRLSPDLLPPQLREERHEVSEATSTLTADQPASYFRSLLCAVLVLLIAEPCLAWRLGSSRR